MDATALDPEAARSFMEALSGLKTVVALTLLGGIATVSIVWMWFRYSDRKLDARKGLDERQLEARENARLEAAKDRRAQEMRAAWGDLTKEIKALRKDTIDSAQSLSAHMRDAESNTGRMAKSIDGLNANTTVLHETITGLHFSIKEVYARQSGWINRDDSIKIIETALREIVEREAVSIFAFSLRKNDFSNRAPFIETRVKTEIAKGISRVLQMLSEYRYLAVDPLAYIVQYAKPGSAVRYELCDHLWDAVRSLYPDHSITEDQRAEEMQIRVANVITDAISAGRAKAEDFYRVEDTALESRRKFKSDPALPAAHAS